MGEGPEPGDIIHSVNTTPIKDIAGLKQAIKEVPAGNAIVLQVEHDGALSYLVMESE